MMRYSVYKHTNLSNGKSYVGVTSLKPEKRWKGGLGYKKQPKFFSAILKHGWDGFSHEVLAVCDDEYVAYQTEIALIEKFDCIDNGYNVAQGGRDMSCAFERKAVDKYDLDTGNLICTYPSAIEAANDVGASDSHISECCNGIHETAAGFGWAYHGMPYKKLSHCYRYAKIEKVDPRTWEVLATYDSQKDAAEDAGVSKSLINLCCKGKLKTGAGYVWRYA